MKAQPIDTLVLLPDDETRANFHGMPLTDPSVWDDLWQTALDLLWPGWEHYDKVPPLDDIDIRDAVKDKQIPAWVIDRKVLIREFGGNAWARRERLTVTSL